MIQQVRVISLLYFNYWTESNPSNDFPALNANRETKSYIGYGSLNYVDGSFFKIKNITLGYTFPERLLKKCRHQQMPFICYYY